MSTIFEITIRHDPSHTNPETGASEPYLWRCVASDGTAYTYEDVSVLLRQVRTVFQRSPDTRVLTMSDLSAQEAPPVLPEGWEVTLDGYSQTVVGGVATNARTYRRLADDLVLEAPCGPAGEVTVGTLAGLEKAPKLVIVGE